ncbi:MAG: hypothetical protein AAGB93_05705 [Planctomycetota bacterium]
MSSPSHTVALTLFGLAVVTSGLVRYLTQEGGEKGLWFGLVMGSAGLVAARLSAVGRSRSALGLAAPTLAFVGGWFCYESFVLKGVAEAEVRQLVIIAVTALTAVVLVVGRSGDEAAAENA